MQRDRPVSSPKNYSGPASETVFSTIMAVVTALALGAGSAVYALQARDESETTAVGGWTSQAVFRTGEANPYVRARAALSGLLPLGQAEGIAFKALRDTDGALLLMRCRYRMNGFLPPARLWTLSAFSADGRAESWNAAALTSHQVLYAGDGAVTIEIGPQAAPGNWLKTDGPGGMALALTLYDTPSVSRGGISRFVLPSIGKVGCDA